ncbi:MAG: TIR domain-containing protein [Ruminiclostridium sp.]
MGIFVSYSWINEKPDDNVLKLVDELRCNGYDVVCDVMLSQHETAIHFPKMMAQNLKKADKVIIVLSEKYKEKADLFSGGVGDEYQYIIGDIKSKSKKYILVTFENNRDKVTPDFLRGREIVFLDKNKIICDNLLHKINETDQCIFSPVNPIKTLPNVKIISEAANNNDSSILVISDYSTGETNFIKTMDADWGKIVRTIKELEETNERFYKEILSDLSGYNKKLSWIEKIAIGSPNPYQTEVLSIAEKDKEVFRKYFSNRGIQVPDRFWYLGGLKYDKSRSYYNFYGPREFKIKLAGINNVYNNIIAINAYNDFLKEIEGKRIMKCMIKNIGGMIDEDISVRLIFEKGRISDVNIPIPETKMIPDCVCDDFLIIIRPDMSNLFIIERDLSRNIAVLNLNKKYGSLFQYYSFFNLGDKDVLEFQVPYLKHNTSVSFPTILVCDKNLSCFEYEIRSKNSPRVISERCTLL